MIFKKRSREIAWARDLVDMSWGPRAARVLQVAGRLGLLQRLASSPAASANLAAEMKLLPDMVEKILIACAALGLAVRTPDGWDLSPKGRATFDPSSPLYQGHAVAHAADVWDFWNDLEQAVRGQEGNSAFQPGARRRRSHRDFILAMHNMAMVGRAAELADRVDLSGRRRLMDVGGGPGTYSMALCERYPDLHATIFDLPDTLAIAREVIARFGMGDRVDTVEGDWERDEFGRDNDVVLMSNVMHGPESGAEMMLAKAARSMAPGGVLIVQEFLLNAGKTGPLAPALFNIMVGAFSIDELTERIAAAGFSRIEHQQMPPDLGTTLLTATK